MRILICTGIYPPDIGGPALYAENLFKEFQKVGHITEVATYGIENKLPVGIRHIFYFFKILFKVKNSDLILILDTFSVGLPAIFAGKILRKKTILRIGGDFLWESYIEKGGTPVSLQKFYEKIPKLSFKESVILKAQEWIFNKCSALVFTTEWQRDIFRKYYKLDDKKTYIVDNFFLDKISSLVPEKKVFLYAGRPIKLKNIEIIKEIFNELPKSYDISLELVSSLSHNALIEKMKGVYAVILPSFSDVSPNFIIDAISLNKPFVLTKECGYAERFKDLGLLINPFEKENIKDKILMMANQANYDKFKKNLEEFHYIHSWSDIAREFVEIYKKI